MTTDRLTGLLSGMGIVISNLQVVRLLAQGAQMFAFEDVKVLRAGLATASWITVDDTSARHARRDGYTTQIAGNRFTAFRTGSSKSRANFLSILRAGSSLFVINAAALDYMRRRGLPEPALAALDGASEKEFADATAFNSHLDALRVFDREAAPGSVVMAAEGAMWGAIRKQGLLEGTVVISDGAGQVSRRRSGSLLAPCGAARSQTHPGHRRAAPRDRRDAPADLVVLRRSESIVSGAASAHGVLSGYRRDWQRFESIARPR